MPLYRRWREQRAKTIDTARVPNSHVFLASQATRFPTGFESLSRSVEGARSLETGYAASPARRFGTLVHGVLRDVPLDADRRPHPPWAHLNARIVGAPAEEVEAACARVEAALAHPLPRSRAAQPSASIASIP